MRVEVAWSTVPDARAAVESACEDLLRRLGAKPNFLFLYASASYDWDALAQTLRGLAPGVPVHGGSSCLGVMTDEGFHSNDGFGLGMLGILDPRGSFGVGAARQGGDAREAAMLAARRAIERAGRLGEVPALLWITAAPGAEESVLEGLVGFFGPNVPILGGSSADNTVSGEWKQIADGEVFDDAVVVGALFPSDDLAFAFHSGYEPTGFNGRVTRASGREISEIGGRKAAEVYDEWTGHIHGDLLHSEGNILLRTTLHPLGRVAGTVLDMPYYLLSHPEKVTADRGLTLFTDVREGDEVFQMHGTPDKLLDRAGRVAAAALDAGDLVAGRVAGALVTYCAGCMLTVRPEMEEVVRGLRAALPGKPFLGIFTFGEQGCFPSGENRHGNLMISAILFGGRDPGRA